MGTGSSPVRRVSLYPRCSGKLSLRFSFVQKNLYINTLLALLNFILDNSVGARKSDERCNQNTGNQRLLSGR